MLWIENKIGVAGFRGRLRNHKELLKKASSTKHLALYIGPVLIKNDQLKNEN